MRNILGKRGSSGIGYGLIVGLISVVALGAITGVGQQTDDLFGSVGTTLDDVVQENVSFPSPEASASASAGPTSGATCQALFSAGQTVSGTYTLDPDGPGGSPSFSAFCNMTQEGGGWTRCYDLTNTSAEDISAANANAWFDDCVDYTMASWSGSEVMVVVGNPDSPDYVNSGSRTNSWTYTQVTGDGTSNEHDYSSHANRITLNGGSDVLSIAGSNANNGGCGGDWGQGYTIQVRDANSGTYHKDVLVGVMAYLRPNANNRNFYNFTESDEIMFNGGSVFSTCNNEQTATPGYLGEFGFYVR